MANLSEQFEIYLQTGDICKYLNIVYQNITSYGHVNFALLAKKFSLIDEENKANGNMSILCAIFPTLNHQLIVGDCAYSILRERILVSYLFLKDIDWIFDNIIILYSKDQDFIFQI